MCLSKHTFLQGYVNVWFAVGEVGRELIYIRCIWTVLSVGSAPKAALLRYWVPRVDLETYSIGHFAFEATKRVSTTFGQATGVSTPRTQGRRCTELPRFVQNCIYVTGDEKLV